MQAAFQKHPDNAVSETVNLPQNAGPGEIKKAYLQAYGQKSKGVIAYMYSSKSDQVLTLESPYEGLTKNSLWQIQSSEEDAKALLTLIKIIN